MKRNEVAALKAGLHGSPHPAKASTHNYSQEEVRAWEIGQTLAAQPVDEVNL